MIFNMFLGVVATIVLNPSKVTVLDFEYRVLKVVSSVDKSTMFKELSRDKKTLVFQPKSKNINGNLVVMTTGGNYNFDFRLGENAHRSIYIKNGEIDNNYKTSVVKKDYSIRESSTSIIFTNLSKKSVSVNGTELRPKSNIVLPKGPPVFLNNKRVFL